MSSSSLRLAVCAAAGGWLALRLRRVAYASSFLALRMDSMVCWRLRRPVSTPTLPPTLTDLRALGVDMLLLPTPTSLTHLIPV